MSASAATRELENKQGACRRRMTRLVLRICPNNPTTMTRQKIEAINERAWKNMRRIANRYPRSTKIRVFNKWCNLNTRMNKKLRRIILDSQNTQISHPYHGTTPCPPATTD
jgi:hypothetical protein